MFYMARLLLNLAINASRSVPFLTPPYCDLGMVAVLLPLLAMVLLYMPLLLRLFPLERVLLPIGRLNFLLATCGPVYYYCGRLPVFSLVDLCDERLNLLH
jgi:hypothetical protein